MTGFEFAYGKITITHQAHQDEPERNMLYAIIIQIVPKPLQYCIGFWLQRFWNRNSGQLIENAFHYRIRRYLLQIQNVLSPGQRVCHVPHRFFRNGLCLYMGLRSCLLDILDDLHKYPSFQTVEKQFYTERYSWAGGTKPKIRALQSESNGG